MSGVNGNSKDVDIDLGRLFAALWERKVRIAALTASVAGIAFVAAGMMSPAYKGEARVLIETRTPAFDSTDRQATTDGSVLDTYNIASQAQILQSTDLIRQVARDMKLYDIAEFEADGNQGLVSSLLVAVGLKANPQGVAPEDRVIKAFREKLQVYQVETSRVIAVEFSSKNPSLAAAIPNEMIRVYLSMQSGAKLDSNSEAARWLEPEIASLRTRVQEAEKKVADYRASSDLLETGESGTFAARQLSDISTELARVRAERANAEARAQNVRAALKSGQSAETIPDVVASPLIQRLKETESQIQSQISDLSISLLEGHPRLKGLRGQLSGIRQQISTETRKVLESLDGEANVGRLREQQLVQQLNVLKADQARAGDRGVGLAALEREAAAQRQLLETYLARFREASSRMDRGSSPADARVISAAVEPREPYFPKVGPIVIVSALAAFLLYCMAIMLAELFSGRALRPVGRNEAEAEAEALPAPAPVVIIPPAPVAAVETKADSDDGDDFTIETVAAWLADENLSPVVVMSPTGDEGSTATVMLARTLANAGRTVLLVDMTATGCPTLLMAEEAALPGITDLLDGKAAFGDIIHNDRLSEVHIVPGGNADHQRAMRAADRLAIVVGALCDAYDTVLVEFGQADVATVARLAGSLSAELVLSIPEPEEKAVESLLASLEKHDFTDILLMSGSRAGKRDNSRRDAA